MKICVCGNKFGFGNLVKSILHEFPVDFVEKPKHIGKGYDFVFVLGENNQLKEKRQEFCMENGKNSNIAYIDYSGNGSIDTEQRRNYWERKGVKYFSGKNLDVHELIGYLEKKELQKNN